MDLADARGATLTGGKAAWLGKLLRAGVKVPNGFVVTTFIEFPLSRDVKTVILNKFDELKLEKVAVRSSAAAEDGAEKSFAGQFDTFLDVTRDDLLDKIAAVHQSAKNATVKSYSEVINSAVAVVVQQMIASEISGVAFSVNPINQNADEIVIEAVNGLGEKLVSGLTTPDLFIVDKTSGDILADETGAEEVNLPDENLATLINYVKEIEQLADRPMDIEWSLADNQIYILQARPITTLNRKGQP
jgi:pyruvate,water dikinase